VAKKELDRGADRDDAKGADTAMARLRRHLIDTRKIDLWSYKPGCIGRRIESRVRATKSSDVETYLRLVKRTPAELDNLLDALTINVTSFFRNPTTFEAMRHKVFEPLFKIIERDERPGLRILSAGCATGEEPYSIAILLLQHFNDVITRAKVSVSVTGLDIDPEVVRYAERGVYLEKHLEGVPPQVLEEFFERVSVNEWVVAGAARARVGFRQANLLDGILGSGFDVVVCRNTLIYFRDADRTRCIQRFVEALRDGGFLVLGRAEALPSVVRPFVVCLDPKEKIFQKRKGAAGATA
jgi:chemotaxis methyl-accepting protein methylase